jgi:hypothetical protein
MGEGTQRVEPRTKDKVDAALKMIEDIRKTGTLSDGAYYKCLVSLAYEYCMAEEDQLALVLLAKAPAEYYKVVQPQQMEDDASYRDLVILLAYRIIQMGVVDGAEEVHAPTMPPGIA